MDKKVLLYLSVLLCVLTITSCSEPEDIEKEYNSVFPKDTASINTYDLESYKKGKCIMLSFEKQIYSIPYSQLTVDTAYSDVDWIIISYYSTYVTVTVEENYSCEYRNCHAYYRLTGNEKYDTVIVSQGPKDTFYINNTSDVLEYNLDFREHDLFFEVFSNVEYSIEIPDTAQKWIRPINTSKTKSIFKDSRFGIMVSANDGEYRETYITIKSTKSNEYQRIKITQDKKYNTLDRVIASNSELSIFYQAIVLTGLKDTLELCYDYSYPEIEYEWTEQALRDGHGMNYSEDAYMNEFYYVYPDKREFKYTIFAVPDKVLKQEYNINNVEDLRDFAKTIYPDGANLPDSNPFSSLYKLIAYHILPCHLSYAQLNTSDSIILAQHRHWDEHDIEDFYETMLPHSIMRISTPCCVDDTTKAMGIFINRKGTIKMKNLTHEGVEITNPSYYPDNISRESRNGEYHYVNRLLLYNNDTRIGALNTRMRIMASTLSPDFINSGGRGRLNDASINSGTPYINKMCMVFKESYSYNYLWDTNTLFYVRYRDSSFPTYNGDEVTIEGVYDLSFKLPPVPFDGNYEIRILNNAMTGRTNDRGIVQFYIHQFDSAIDSKQYWRSWDWVPCNLPVDFSIGGDDEQIGYISDLYFYSNMNPEEAELAILNNDKKMKNHGYMKGPDSYGVYHYSPDYKYFCLRDDSKCYRVVVCTNYLKSNKDYYIRMRQIYDNYAAKYHFSFIEIVPYSVYSGENGPEDRH